VLGVQAVGLVLDVEGDAGVGVGVGTGVVAAEEKLSDGQDHAHVRLCAATVAAVGGGQRFCRQGGHDDIQPSPAQILPTERVRFAAGIAA
jgi:hypothetical protein